MQQTAQKGDVNENRIPIIPDDMAKKEISFPAYNGAHRRRIADAAYQHTPGACFVYIDGGKGTGKSSILAKLLEVVSQRGYRSAVRPFRESAHDPVVDAKRQYLREHGESANQDYVLRLISAGRQSILEKQLIPYLNKEDVIFIYNRSIVTTLAHQMDWIYGKFEARGKLMTGNDTRADLGRVLKTAERTFIKPDLAVILLCDPEVAWQRVVSRATGGRDVESGLSQSNLARMNAAYKAVSGGVPNSYILDVTQVSEPCTTAQQIVAEMEKRGILRK